MSSVAIPIPSRPQNSRVLDSQSYELQIEDILSKKLTNKKMFLAISLYQEAERKHAWSEFGTSVESGEQTIHCKNSAYNALMQAAKWFDSENPDFSWQHEVSSLNGS